MKKYVVIRTLAGGEDAGVLGYAKQYANGQWVFSPAVCTGRKPTGKRYKTYEACLPSWTGGVDGTRSEKRD